MKLKTMMMSAAMVMAAGLAIGPAAFASSKHVTPRVERIQWLAHEVEDSAERVRAGTRDRGRLTLREVQALRRLDALVRDARAFHQEVERRPFSWRAAEDLDALLVTHERVNDSLHLLRMTVEARREKRRLSGLVERLDTSYATLARAPHPGEHRGRQDDRDDRVGRR
ncbi:MAG: hypothetical protein ACREAA_12180 [Candidatus Polarisedimenticolia bacterium]